MSDSNTVTAAAATHNSLKADFNAASTSAKSTNVKQESDSIKSVKSAKSIFTQATNHAVSNLGIQRNLEQEIIMLINETRKDYGLSELKIRSDLQDAAYVRARECETSFSHTRPDGSAWYTVNNSSYGENLAMGSVKYEGEDFINSWLDSPSHRENLLDPSYAEMGLSVLLSDGQFYVANEFY